MCGARVGFADLLLVGREGRRRFAFGCSGECLFDAAGDFWRTRTGFRFDVRGEEGGGCPTVEDDGFFHTHTKNFTPFGVHGSCYCC